MKREPPLVKINDSILISTGTKTTKICPWCGGRIVFGLYYAIIRDRHRIIKSGKTYSSNNIYIHPECFEPLSKKLITTIKKYHTTIERNKAAVTLERI